MANPTDITSMTRVCITVHALLDRWTCHYMVTRVSHVTTWSHECHMSLHGHTSVTCHYMVTRVSHVTTWSHECHMSLHGHTSVTCHYMVTRVSHITTWSHKCHMSLHGHTSVTCGQQTHGGCHTQEVNNCHIPIGTASTYTRTRPAVSDIHNTTHMAHYLH